MRNERCAPSPRVPRLYRWPTVNAKITPRLSPPGASLIASRGQRQRKEDMVRHIGTDDMMKTEFAEAQQFAHDSHPRLVPDGSSAPALPPAAPGPGKGLTASALLEEATHSSFRLPGNRQSSPASIEQHGVSVQG